MAHKHKWASWFGGQFDTAGRVTHICICGLKRETNTCGFDYRRYYRGGVVGRKVYIRSAPVKEFRG